MGHDERGLPVGFLLVVTDKFWQEQQRGEGSRCAEGPPAPVTLQLGSREAGKDGSKLNRHRGEDACFTKRS